MNRENYIGGLICTCPYNKVTNTPFVAQFCFGTAGREERFQWNGEGTHINITMLNLFVVLTLACVYRVSAITCSVCTEVTVSDPEFAAALGNSAFGNTVPCVASGGETSECAETCQQMELTMHFTHDTAEILTITQRQAGCGESGMPVMCLPSEQLAAMGDTLKMTFETVLNGSGWTYSNLEGSSMCICETDLCNLFEEPAAGAEPGVESEQGAEPEPSSEPKAETTTPKGSGGIVSSSAALIVSSVMSAYLLYPF